MDIPFLVLTIAASCFLPRGRALLVTAALWAIAVALVLWGPAHNSGVHPASAGFWVPWGIVGLLGAGLSVGITMLRSARRRKASAS